MMVEHGAVMMVDYGAVITAFILVALAVALIVYIWTWAASRK